MMDALDAVEVRSETPSPPPLARHSLDLKELPPFPHKGFDPDCGSSRIRSLSSSAIHKNSTLFSPRPLSARSPKDAVDESMARALINACSGLKKSPSEPLHLPPVPSKPPSPESVASGGKVVRRRGLGLKKPERSPSSIGDTGSARGGSPASLQRRATIDCGTRSTSAGKLQRRRTVEDSPGGRNASDKPSIPRRRSLQTKEDLELAKLDAFRALAESDASGTLAEQVTRLTRHVLKCHGTKAFSPDHVARALERVQKEEVDTDGIRLERVDAVSQAVRYMSEAVNLGFSDVVGQILWRNKQVGTLREKARHKEAAEDISWAVACAEDATVAFDVLKALDDVFDMFEFGQKGKGIGSKAWSRIAKFVEMNPVLKRKVNPCDVDRLWYAATHKPHMETPLKEIGRRAFKELLLSWCEAMAVHPWMVFVAIGSHANDREYSENWQKLWH